MQSGAAVPAGFSERVVGPAQRFRNLSTRSTGDLQAVDQVSVGLAFLRFLASPATAGTRSISFGRQSSAEPVLPNSTAEHTWSRAIEVATAGFARLDQSYRRAPGKVASAYRSNASPTQAANCSGVHPDSSTSSRYTPGAASARNTA